MKKRGRPQGSTNRNNIEVDYRFAGAGFLYGLDTRVGWIQSHSKQRIVLWLTNWGAPAKDRDYFAFTMAAKREWPECEVCWSSSREEQVRLCDDVPEAVPA